ncbi:hypothetical protein [Spiroplasma endosymbiont of Danaus chrysippus]|nr:hypothetical protein [Spiroplasma endosymbiont of Danaus chrysippus]
MKCHKCFRRASTKLTNRIIKNHKNEDKDLEFEIYFCSKHWIKEIKINN